MTAHADTLAQGGRHAGIIATVNTASDKTGQNVKLDLRTIRQTAGLSTPEQAEGMGLASFNTVGQIERRSDWLVSTVAQYIRAAGGTAVLTVEIAGQTLEFQL